MAYLAEDDKLQDPNNPSTQTDQQQAGSTPGTTSAPGSSDVGTGVSAAGVGAGGTGGWTNIQAYLNANKGNNTTVDALNNQVGGAFQKDQDALTSSADKAESDATSNAFMGHEKFQENTAQALSKSNQSDAESALKQYLNGTYKGPTEYNYGLSADTQNYGQGLQSDDNFQGLLNNVYNKAAGGQISTGQLALQKQLDYNNPNFAETKDKLNSQYSALQSLAGLRVPQVQNAVNSARDNYESGKSAYRDFISSEANKQKDIYDGINIPGNILYPEYQQAAYDKAKAAEVYNTFANALGLGSTLEKPSYLDPQARTGGGMFHGDGGTGSVTTTQPQQPISSFWMPGWNGWYGY